MHSPLRCLARMPLLLRRRHLGRRITQLVWASLLVLHLVLLGQGFIGEGFDGGGRDGGGLEGTGELRGDELRSSAPGGDLGSAGGRSLGDQVALILSILFFGTQLARPTRIRLGSRRRTLVVYALLAAFVHQDVRAVVWAEHETVRTLAITVAGAGVVILATMATARHGAGASLDPSAHGTCAPTDRLTVPVRRPVWLPQLPRPPPTGQPTSCWSAAA